MKNIYKIFTLIVVILLTGSFIRDVGAATPACLPFQGCTGTSTAPSAGQILVGNASGRYDYVLPNVANGWVQLDANGNINATLIARPDTYTNLSNQTFQQGELIYATDTKQLRLGDGNVTPFGVSPIPNVNYATSTGFIGIATSTPQYPLTVKGTIGLDNNAFAFATGTRNYYLFGATATTTTAMTGFDDFCFGVSACSGLAGGGNDVVFGNLAGQSMTGSNNFLVGSQAGRNIRGSNNIVFGTFAGKATGNSGSDNTIIGESAGVFNTSGGFNVFIGPFAGASNTIGTDLVAIGDSADFGANNLSNSFAIGVGAIANCSNCGVLGGDAAAGTAVNVGVGTTTPYANMSLTGSADHPELAIQPVAGQTSHLVDYYNSAGVLNGYVKADGAGWVVQDNGSVQGGILGSSGTKNILLEDGAGYNSMRGFQGAKFTNAYANNAGIGIIDMYGWTFTPVTLQQTTGEDYNVLSIVPTYQSNGNASSTDFWDNRTEVSVGTGLQSLFRGTVNGVNKFWADDTGKGYFANSLGIGTTSPAFQLSLGSTTATTIGNFEVDTKGNIYGGGGKPSVSCGATCTLDTNAHDSSGIIFISGVQTSVTLTFYTSKPWAPHCTVTDNVTTGTYEGSTTATTLVMSTAASLGTASISYNCQQ